VIKVSLDYDGKTKSEYFQCSDWWWQGDLLCLIVENGKRVYFNSKEINRLEIEEVKK